MTAAERAPARSGAGMSVGGDSGAGGGGGGGGGGCGGATLGRYPNRRLPTERVASIVLGKI